MTLHLTDIYYPFDSGGTMRLSTFDESIRELKLSQLFVFIIERIPISSNPKKHALRFSFRHKPPCENSWWEKSEIGIGSHMAQDSADSRQSKERYNMSQKRNLFEDFINSRSSMTEVGGLPDGTNLDSWHAMVYTYSAVYHIIAWSFFIGETWS